MVKIIQVPDLHYFHTSAHIYTLLSPYDIGTPVMPVPGSSLGVRYPAIPMLSRAAIESSAVSGP